MFYFEIVLYDTDVNKGFEISTEKVIDDKNINQVMYNDPHYLVCQNKSDKGYTTLLIVPHSRVKSITRKEV